MLVIVYNVTNASVALELGGMNSLDPAKIKFSPYKPRISEFTA